MFRSSFSQYPSRMEKTSKKKTSPSAMPKFPRNEYYFLFIFPGIFTTTQRSTSLHSKASNSDLWKDAKRKRNTSDRGIWQSLERKTCRCVILVSQGRYTQFVNVTFLLKNIRSSKQLPVWIYFKICGEIRFLCCGPFVLQLSFCQPTCMSTISFRKGVENILSLLP